MAKRRADEPNSLNHERREPCEKGEDTFSHKTTQRTQQINNRVSVFALSEFFRGHYAALFNLFAYSEYFVVKKRVFLGAGQESILDKKAPDTPFDQCLQGFRILKKPPTMSCTILAFCAIMKIKSRIIKFICEVLCESVALLIPSFPPNFLLIWVPVKNTYLTTSPPTRVFTNVYRVFVV